MWATMFWEQLVFEGVTTYSKDIRGTVDEWQYTELYIKTGENVETIKVSLGLGGYGNLNTGKASFDNVMLEKVDNVPDGARCVIVENPDNTSSDSSEDDQKNSTGKHTGQIYVVLAYSLGNCFGDHTILLFQAKELLNQRKTAVIKKSNVQF